MCFLHTQIFLKKYTYCILLEGWSIGLTPSFFPLLTPHPSSFLIFFEQCFIYFRLTWNQLAEDPEFLTPWTTPLEGSYYSTHLDSQLCGAWAGACFHTRPFFQCNSTHRAHSILHIIFPTYDNCYIFQLYKNGSTFIFFCCFKVSLCSPSRLQMCSLSASVSWVLRL